MTSDESDKKGFKRQTGKDLVLSVFIVWEKALQGGRGLHGGRSVVEKSDRSTTSLRYWMVLGRSVNIVLYL